MEKKKIIYAIDLIILIGSIFVLIFLGRYAQPLVIAPLNNFETSNSVLFSIENADTILIDTNIEFSNPKIFQIKDGLGINLEPGNYYWKAEGIAGLKTEIRTLNILSKIDLRLRKTSEGYDITNAGNTKLNIEVYNDTKLVDSFKLNPEEEKQADGNNFVGGLE